MEMITVSGLITTLNLIEVKGQSNIARVYNVITTLEEDAEKLTPVDIQTLIAILNQVEIMGKNNMGLLYKAIEVLTNVLRPQTETFIIKEEDSPHEQDSPK